MAAEYALKRNVGTVGRPHLPCAVCGWSPSGHVLSARLDLELARQPDKGLCNVHARGLAQNELVTEANLAQMRDERPREGLAARFPTTTTRELNCA